MKAGYLADLLEPFKLVCEPNALVPEYRLLLVENDWLGARTERYHLECLQSLGLDQPFGLEVWPLINIAESLPSAAEIEFDFKDNQLAWKCGAARGQLATKPAFKLPKLPEMPKAMADCSHSLSALFELGAIACSNTALQSAGLYGMEIRQEGKKLWCLSSDDVTIAVASIPSPKGLKLAKTYTVGGRDPSYSPSGISIKPNLLVAMAGQKDARIGFTDDAILFDGPRYQAAIHLVLPLRYDLYKMASDYFADDAVHDIAKERVQLFVRRAFHLAEARHRASVTVRAEGDQLLLEFNEIGAQSSEYYPITEGFKVDEPVAVTVDAVRLARALSHCEQMLLDNMPRHMIVFRSKSADFHYIVSGKR